MKSDEGVLSPQTNQPIVAAWYCCSVTCIKLEMLALFLPAAHPSVRAEVVFVSGVCCRRMCQSACLRARCTEEAKGVKVGEHQPPPLPPKKVWIYSSEVCVTERVVSPTHTLLSFPGLCPQRNMAWRQERKS